MFFFAVFNVLLSMKKSDLEICSLQISCLQRNPNSFPFVENYDFVNSKCRAHFFDLSYLTLKGLPTPENLNGLKKFNDVYRWCSNYSRESYTYTRIIHHHRIIKFSFFFVVSFVYFVYIWNFYFHHCIDQWSRTPIQKNNKNIWARRSIFAFGSLNRDKIEGVCWYASGNHKENITSHNTCFEFNAYPVFFSIYKLSLSCLLTGIASISKQERTYLFLNQLLSFRFRTEILKKLI